MIAAVPGTGLGLLRDGRRTEDPHRLSELTPGARRMVFSPAVLMLTTANSRSTVLRADYLAYIGVKRFDRDGRVVGERRFLGLYNSDVYRDSVLDIPLLREKAAEVLDRAGFAPESHSGRALRQILETYPRNELFQIDADELFTIASGILELQDRRQVRLFERRDDYGRFVSCLVYLPRDRYSTDRAEQIAEALREAYGGTGTEHDVLIGMGALARLYVRVALGPEVRQPVIAEVEKRLSAIVADWADELGAALVGELGEDAGLAALARFADAFPADYRDAYPPAVAAADVSRLLEIEAGADLITALHRPLGAPPEEVRFTLMRPGAPLVLSEVLPLLEDLGVTVVDERPHEIRVDGPSVWRYDIGLRVADPERIDERAVREEFCATFAALFRGELESDGLNELVLVGGLSARQVDVLRAYAKYLRQVGLSFSQRYVEATLARHGPIVGELVRLFEARFDPAIDTDAASGDSPVRQADLAAITASITAQLDAVPSLDEDRILRSFLTLIQATTRTNAYRPARRRRPRVRPPARALLQARPGDDPRPAAASADVRDLGVLTPRRGRAPPRRAGRPRRAALERPAGGLPHRGAGADEGPDGEERGHHPGRGQGWLRREAARADQRPRRRCAARWRRATGSSSPACSTSPTTSSTVRSCRRPTSSATTATIPTSSWRPTRARPRSPTSPTRSPPATGSGWGTRSRRGAAPGTTTRPWASPPAARGRAPAATPAPRARRGQRPADRRRHR